MSTSDAAFSNAGDRYHFVYVARRMLDMLPPGSNLQLIQMENISSADQRWVGSPDELLGVDLTEYYDGLDFQSSSKSAIVQVKYSPTHPNATWTLNRLCKNKASSKGNEIPGSSVLRKLANAFSVAYRSLGEACRYRLQVRLLSNQSLDRDLDVQIDRIQELLAGYSALSDTASGKQLMDAVGETAVLLQELKHITNLSWRQLSAFLRCWDLAAFGQPMATEQENEFARVLDQFVDVGMHFGNLISFVQEHALPNRPTFIDKDQVYGQLRIRETSFFPAAPVFAPIDNVLTTQSVRSLVDTIDESSNAVVLFHGLSGTGKSTTLRLIKEEYADRKAVVIYDCYGGGENLSTGRFPYKKFFVQVINELEGLLHTNIFATTQIDDDELMQRFKAAIERAAKLADCGGQQLIIAVDAIDDAVEAALDQPNRQHESFVPYLWSFNWPHNCVLVVSARTENLPLISIECDFSEVEITGFTQHESTSYLRCFWPDVAEEVLIRSHERTNGNPRVQARLAELAERESPHDLMKFVDEQAQQTAFKYYEGQVPKRLKTEADWLLLAVLREATQFITVETLAAITGRTTNDVHAVLKRLYFGLRTTLDQQIVWSDKDFVSFVRKSGQAQQAQARSLLADYCLAHFGESDYADHNLSRHLYLAGRYQQLLDWWMSDNRLIDRMAATEPHVEDIVTDLQYTLLAALEVEDFKDALVLLSIAAEIVQGVDVFGEGAKQHLRAVVECNYLGRMLSYLRKSEDGSSLMGYYFAAARVLASQDASLDLARQLIDEGYKIHEQSKHTNRPEAKFSAKMVSDLCMYAALAHDFDDGLQRMGEWQPPETVNPLYADLVHDWCQETGRSAYAHQVILRHDLDEQQRTYCLLGLLTSSAAALEPQLVRSIAKEVRDYVESGCLQLSQPRWPQSERKSKAAALVEALLSAEYSDLAASLLPYWPTPRVTHENANISEFLERRAIEVALDMAEFEPDSFELSAPAGERDRSEYQQRDQAEKVQRIRHRMRHLYPPLLFRARAALGVSEGSILEEIEAYLDGWAQSTRPYWYQLHKYKVDIWRIAGWLLEAIVQLPGYHLGTARSIIETSDKLLDWKEHDGHRRYAEILSHNEKYHAEVERLIHRRARSIKAPDYRAGEAVEALLELYPVAAKLDHALAHRIFIQARIEASGWDRRVDGLAFALLSTLENSDHIHSTTDDQLGQLVSVFKTIKRVAEGEDVEIHLDWYVRLITRIRPSLTFHLLKQFDTSDFLDIEDAISPAALGLCDMDQIPVQAAQALVHIASSSEKGREIYRQTIPYLQAQGADVDDAIVAFARFVRTQVVRGYRERAAREFVQWASEQGISDHLAVREMGWFADRLQGFQQKTQSLDSPDASGFYEKSEELILRFGTAISESPQAALAVLEQSVPEDMRWLRYERMQDIVNAMINCLRSADVPILFQFVEKYAQVNYEPYAFSLIGKIGSQVPSSELVREAFRDSLTRLLTPRNIRSLARWIHREHVSALLNCPLLDKSTYLDIILRAASNALPSLPTDTLYGLVGSLSALLSADDSMHVFDALLQRTTARLQEPCIVVSVPPEADTFVSLIQLLAHYLGHPDQSLCWKVLYALVDIALYFPEKTIPVLVAELPDEAHDRWMTKRVWLLFLFHHLSIRCPAALISYKDTFLDHAMSTQFPHARVRHEAQKILINLERAQPGTLSETELNQVKEINKPIGYITKDDVGDFHRPYDGVQWTRRENVAFRFNSMDTLPYWYSPLGHVFGGHRCHVADIAYKWIVEEWNITDAKCGSDADWTRSKYSWEDTSNRQGGLPRVESLETYAELHAMFLAAGELVDSTPVFLDESWETDDRWKSWMRSEVRAADPLLVGRYPSELPVTPDHYGFFLQDFDKWSRKDVESEYEQELWADESEEWVILKGYRSGSFDDRRFSVRVRSFFVHPKTSASLARFLNSQDRFIGLPHTEVSYDSILQEVEDDLAAWWKSAEGLNEAFFIDELNEHPFVLFGATVGWGQDLPLHSHDPKLDGRGFGIDLFAPRFFVHQDIHIDPMTLDWRTQDGKKVAYNEFWHDSEGHGDYSRPVEGTRLVVQRGVLADYLKQIGMDLVFSVRLSRSRPYSHGYKSDAYDEGTVRAYIFRANGELESVMQQELIDKGRVLAEELDSEKRSTLHRWMAHYLTELMEKAKSSDDKEAQLASRECAVIITKLWKQKVEQEATQLSHRVWRTRLVPSDDLDYEGVAGALDNTDALTLLSAESWIELYHTLSDVENRLLMVFAISSVANAAENDVEVDTAHRFMEQEHGKELVEQLAQIFPSFAELELTDSEAIQQQVNSALRQLYVLRMLLLWKNNSEIEE